MIETIIASAITGLLGGLGASPIFVKKALEKLRAKIREEEAAKAAEEVELLVQRETVLAEEKESSKLALELLLAEQRKEQAARDAVEVQLLERRNRQRELGAEARRSLDIQKEAENLRQQALLEAERQKTLELELQIKAEKNRAAELLREDRELEMQQLRTRELELMEKMRLEREEQEAKNTERFHCLKKDSDATLATLLKDDQLVVCVDQGKDVEGVKVNAHLKAFTDLLVSFDLLLVGPYCLALQEDIKSQYPTLATRQDTAKDCLNTWNGWPSDYYASTAYELLKSQEHALLLLVHPQAYYVRWELALIRKGKEIIALSAEVCRPSSNEAELTETFIKLLGDLFSRFPKPENEGTASKGEGQSHVQLVG